MSQVGIFGNMQMAYGVNPTFSGMTLLNTARNLKTGSVFCDFNAAWYPWDGFWYDNRLGLATDAYPTIATDVSRLGILRQYAGTQATGLVASAMNGLAIGGLTNGITFGGCQFTFEADVYLCQLATAADDFDSTFGFGDSAAAGEHANGAYFLYDRATSLNWLAVTAAGGVRTATDTGIAAAATTWVRIKIIVNYLGTRVDFYINNVLVATNIANIPVFPNVCGQVLKIEKSAGALNVSQMIDWTWFHYDFLVTR
jgi:hypothetical protein